MATSSASACTVESSSRCNVTPDSSDWPDTTLRLLRISHFLPAMSVNRSHTVSSQWESIVVPRNTIVTREPSDENTCANSAATNPPPTMTRCSGSSEIRMIVSLV